jgi:signal transduction histidine kinase
MVEQILLFARTQAPGGAELAATAPETIVGRALTAYGPALREAGMVVERSIEPGLPEILVDSNQIVGCVQNLLQNAVKYAAKGGWVKICAGTVRREDGTWIRIAVRDRGPGISSDDLPHIFDPFQRGEAVRNSQIPGVGLGLSLVKRIVEAHQGKVEVETMPGSGATFFLYLPAQPARKPAAAEVKEVAS